MNIESTTTTVETPVTPVATDAQSYPQTAPASGVKTTVVAAVSGALSNMSSPMVRGALIGGGVVAVLGAGYTYHIKRKHQAEMEKAKASAAAAARAKAQDEALVAAKIHRQGLEALQRLAEEGTTVNTVYSEKKIIADSTMLSQKDLDEIRAEIEKLIKEKAGK